MELTRAHVDGTRKRLLLRLLISSKSSLDSLFESSKVDSFGKQLLWIALLRFEFPLLEHIQFSNVERLLALPKVEQSPLEILQLPLRSLRDNEGLVLLQLRDGALWNPQLDASYLGLFVYHVLLHCLGQGLVKPHLTSLLFVCASFRRLVSEVWRLRRHPHVRSLVHKLLLEESSLDHLIHHLRIG